MLKIDKTKIYGWGSAIRGMRNPLNSWHLSDTVYDCNGCILPIPAIGPKDMNLMRQLAAAGTEHAKYLRYITVTMDVTGPLYWWKEADTYRVGFEKNSCSTMHKIHAKEFALDDFSHDHLDYLSEAMLRNVIDLLNVYRDEFIAKRNKDYWWQMIQLLPSSYNQKRTCQTNYATLRSIYKQRKNHKLDEWHVFCDWVENLPYSELITE